MKMKPKLILATVLIFIGCVIFVGVMSMLNWDFSKISTEKFETNEFKTDEKIKNIENIKIDKVNELIKNLNFDKYSLSLIGKTAKEVEV